MIDVAQLFRSTGVARWRMWAWVALLIPTCVVVAATLNSRDSTGDRHVPELYVVEGRVLVNGEPAQGIHVAFHPLGCPPKLFCPVGRTDRAGVFHLTTRSGSDGAPAGEYYVTFVWPDPTIEFDECESTDPLIHDRFKGLYATTELSGYRATVHSANTSVEYSLWRPRSDDPSPR